MKAGETSEHLVNEIGQMIYFMYDENDETKFPHKLLLSDTKVSKYHKSFENGSSANIKFLKTQFPNMIQSGEILANLLAAMPQGIFLKGVEALKKRSKKSVTVNKCSTRIS